VKKNKPKQTQNKPKTKPFFVPKTAPKPKTNPIYAGQATQNFTRHSFSEGGPPAELRNSARQKKIKTKSLNKNEATKQKHPEKEMTLNKNTPGKKKDANPIPLVRRTLQPANFVEGFGKLHLSLIEIDCYLIDVTVRRG